VPSHTIMQRSALTSGGRVRIGIDRAAPAHRRPNFTSAGSGASRVTRTDNLGPSPAWSLLSRSREERSIIYKGVIGKEKGRRLSVALQTDHVANLTWPAARPRPLSNCGHYGDV
jgi:hypothetical protein